MVGGQALDLRAAEAGRRSTRRDRPARDARPQDRRAASRQCARRRRHGRRDRRRPRRRGRIRHPHRPGVPDRRRHPRRRRSLGRARQDAGKGRRRRQADVSVALRPGRVAPPRPDVAASRRCGRCRRRASADSCRRLPSGSSRAGIEEGIAARHAARRTGTGRHARAGTGADPRRPGARQRPAGDESRPHGPARGRGDARHARSPVCRPRRREAGACARRLRDRSGRAHGARHRRLDRRLHRRAPAAGSDARSWRSTSGTASSTGSCAAIRASS